jgi:hypothetical protein
MRCKGCGYSLFNHRGRTCPECGAPFAPADFEFRANAVEFCCSGCMQPYYGTDPQGLPEPRAFACVTCGASCELGTMVLRPAPGVREDETELHRVPWEDRSLPWRTRFLRTVSEAMVRPSRLGASIAGSREGGSARFLLVLATMASVPTALAVLGFISFLALGAVPPGSAQFSMSLRAEVAPWALGCAMGVATAVAAVFACVLVVAGLATLVLRIAGTDAPWRRVWPTFAYTSAPLVVCAVPCLGPYCGIYVAGTWWLVAAGIALGTSCRASVGRAIAAVAIPAVVVLGLVLGGAVLFVVMPATAAVKAATAAGAAAATAGPAPADGANDEGALDVGADASGDPDSEPMPEAGPDPQSEPPPDREVSP